jgi:hypothetical protein
MVVAAGVTYLSINIWSYSQQWRIELPSIVTFNTEVGDNERLTYAAAIYGMLLLGPPCCCSSAFQSLMRGGKRSIRPPFEYRASADWS